MTKHELALMQAGERMRAAFARWQSWLAGGASAGQDATPELTKAIENWQRVLREVSDGTEPASPGANAPSLSLVPRCGSAAAEADEP